MDKLTLIVDELAAKQQKDLWVAEFATEFRTRTGFLPHEAFKCAEAAYDDCKDMTPHEAVDEEIDSMRMAQ